MKKSNIKKSSSWEKSLKAQQFEIECGFILDDLINQGIVMKKNPQMTFGRRRPDYTPELPLIRVNLDGTLSPSATRLFVTIECKNWTMQGVRDYGYSAIEQAYENRQAAARTLTQDIVSIKSIIFTPIPDRFWPKSRFSKNIIITNNLRFVLKQLYKEHVRRPGDDDYYFQSTLD